MINIKALIIAAIVAFVAYLSMFWFNIINILQPPFNIVWLIITPEYSLTSGSFLAIFIGIIAGIIAYYLLKDKI